MLRPERMSKVSVTGSRAVMPAVIDAIHELNLVHLSDYDGSWEGFDNGNPIEGAEEASEKLVTVRALESTLGLSAEDVGPDGLDDDWEERLERVRTRVNELDDRRGEIREELRQVDERIDRLAPFAELGIDLDLLSGYEYVDVAVGEGSRTEIEASIEDADSIRAYETFTGGDVIAVVAAPSDDAAEDVIDDALVGVEFARHEVPDVDRAPSTYVDELRHRRRQLEADMEDVDRELDRIKLDDGGFLLRVEGELTVEVQRAEAPLQFATTDRAFVAEGWIPSVQFDDLVDAVEDAVGDRVEIEELERAAYDDVHGAEAHTEPEEHAEDEAPAEEESSETEPEKPTPATDGGKSGGRKATDGGSAGAAAGGSQAAVTMDDEPPVVLDNLEPAKPFEVMVKMVSQPRYSELDPTLFVFLTFPFAFGFMIGDIGYGILYVLMGWGAWKIFDSEAGKAIGTIGIWAGVFTILFGWLYDDVFGVHMADLGLGWLPLAGVLDKGLQLTEWAMLWIILSIAFGLVHLNIGLVMGFVNELSHGVKAAVYERLSWILAMNGAFLWIFSHRDAGSLGLAVDLTASGTKPDFLVGTGTPDESAVLYEFVGFVGLPEIVGIVGIATFLVGFVMIGIGEGIAGLFETPAWAFGHVLSYLRMVAVLLAKGGMAFAVNLLVFGAYETPEGYTYFNLPGLDITDISGYEYEALEPGFAGLVHMDPLIVTIPIAILVFVFGHILVLLLGITAAGIQMLRLEYVEFFQKFYEGGGEEYEPFGHERSAQAD